MKEELKRVCELQKAYSSENTDQMKERGILIRTVIPELIRRLEREYCPLLAEFSEEALVEGKDGIGRKTEAPWVRLFSPAMSPSAREGFYVVIHFAADGSAVFVTVGCGSTIWANGDLKPISDTELASKTEWARSVLVEHFGTIEPFSDVIALGARAALPGTFEKATAIAKKIPTDNLDDAEFRHLLLQGVERLAVIYRCQKLGRGLDFGQAERLEIASISRPTRSPGRGQGIFLTAPERRAIEMRAMDLAKSWLEDNGYAVEDMSAKFSFDFLAKKNGNSIKVEVKGTTSDICNTILMTRNEVDLHRNEKGSTALIIVSQIRLDRTKSPPDATGGIAESLVAWDIDQWEREPIAFQIARKR